MNKMFESTHGSLAQSKDEIARAIAEHLRFNKAGDYTLYFNVDEDGNVIVEGVCVVREAT